MRHPIVCVLNQRLKRPNSQKRFVNSISLLIALLSIAAFPAHALEFECESAADTRFIRLELPGITHLCEVTVTHADNERKVMWYANQSTLFCTDKTLELAGKYQNEWGYSCNQWPDHDGIDQLSARQRAIVDVELKELIARGNSQNVPYVVEGVKAASNANRLLVLQFFLHEPTSGTTRDVTRIINDNGNSHNTISQLDSLSQYVDNQEGYVVNSALISSINEDGTMEVITVLDSIDGAVSSSDSGCYGNQTLAHKADGELEARTPHKFTCPDNDAG